MPYRRSETKAVESSRSAEPTRDRILNAAILRFSTQSYDTTALREIAADVGVDVAYVHRCFGSKENLFRAAVRAAWQPERIFAGRPEDLAFVLARNALAERQPNEIRPLDIIIRSFSCPDASRVLRDVLQDDFIAPFRRKREDVSDRQAALVAAFLSGLGILRDVIGCDPVLEKEGGEFEQTVVGIIEKLISSGFGNDRGVKLRSFSERRI